MKLLKLKWIIIFLNCKIFSNYYNCNDIHNIRYKKLKNLILNEVNKVFHITVDKSLNIDNYDKYIKYIDKNIRYCNDLSYYETIDIDSIEYFQIERVNYDYTVYNNLELDFRFLINKFSCLSNNKINADYISKLNELI